MGTSVYSYWYYVFILIIIAFIKRSLFEERFLMRIWRYDTYHMNHSDKPFGTSDQSEIGFMNK